MDSIRITWDADNDTYVIHVPCFKDVVVTIQGLEDLKGEIEARLKEVSA